MFTTESLNWKYEARVKLGQEEMTASSVVGFHLPR